MSFTTNYREYAPDRRLSDFLVCIWSQTVDRTNAGFMQPVFPDGCVDILWRDEEAPVVVGAMTGYRQAALKAGLRLFGLRLIPGQAESLLGLPASEITDLEVPLRDISGPGKHAEPLSRGGRSRVRGELFARTLALFQRDRFAARDAWIHTAVSWLANRPGGKIKQLAGVLGVSERQLNRRFTAGVGYGPKLFQRILRFQRLLDLAGRPEAPGLAFLAMDAGYADQAHMNRECRELAGRSPAGLLAQSHSALAMSDLFNTNRTS